MFQWNYDNDLIEQSILKECQRRVQESLHESDSFIKHPYSLTLDTYKSSLTSLITYKCIQLQSNGIFIVNQNSISKVSEMLGDILKKNSVALYMTENFTLISPDTSYRSKL